MKCIALNIAYQNGSLADFYTAKIKKSGHSNFMDIPFMINLPTLNEAGTIEPKEAIKTTAKLVTSFFDQYLRDKRLPVFEYWIKENTLKYRWSNCIRSFKMPMVVFLDDEEFNLISFERYILSQDFN